MHVSVRLASVSIALAGVVLLACGHAGGDDPTAAATTDPGTPTQGTTNDPAGVGDASTGAAACEELGTIDGKSLVAAVSTLHEWVIAPVTTRQSTTMIVVASGAATELQGKTAPLGAGPNANYATCTHCAAFAVGCSGRDCTNAAWFFAASGSAVFTRIGSAPGQTFAGTLDDVVLRQVHIDPTTLVSTEIPGGGCFHVTHVAFEATVAGDAGASSGDASTPADPDAGDGGNGGGSSGGSGGGGGVNPSISGMPN